MTLTGDTLRNICPSLKLDADEIAEKLNEITPEYGMDSADVLEDFIPNLLVESDQFRTFEENLNYSTQALIDEFSSNGRISPDEAKKYGRNNEHPADKRMIANCIYGGEWGRINLGNTQPNDGWDFRGSGPIQGTGRGVIYAFTKYHNEKFGTSLNVNEVAELMRNKVNLEMGIHFACWFFSVFKNLIPLALSDHFKDIVRRVNGGYNGLNERTEFYERCKKYLYGSSIHNT